MKKPNKFIENYKYKEYIFEITYNKTDGNYHAKNLKAGNKLSEKIV